MLPQRGGGGLLAVGTVKAGAGPERIGGLFWSLSQLSSNVAQAGKEVGTLNKSSSPELRGLGHATAAPGQP